MVEFLSPDHIPPVALTVKTQTPQVQGQEVVTVPGLGKGFYKDFRDSLPEWRLIIPP